MKSLQYENHYKYSINDPFQLMFHVLNGYSKNDITYFHGVTITKQEGTFEKKKKTLKMWDSTNNLCMMSTLTS